MDRTAKVRIHEQNFQDLKLVWVHSDRRKLVFLKTSCFCNVPLKEDSLNMFYQNYMMKDISPSASASLREMCGECRDEVYSQRSQTRPNQRESRELLSRSKQTVICDQHPRDPSECSQMKMLLEEEVLLSLPLRGSEKLLT